MEYHIGENELEVDDVLGCRAGQVVDLNESREVINCHEVLSSI